MTLIMDNGLIQRKAYYVSDYIKNNVRSYTYTGYPTFIVHTIETPPSLDVNLTDSANTHPLLLEEHVNTLVNINYLTPDPVEENVVEEETTINHTQEEENTDTVKENRDLEEKRPVREEEPTIEQTPLINTMKPTLKHDQANNQKEYTPLPTLLNYQDNNIKYSFSNHTIAGFRRFTLKSKNKNVSLKIPESYYKRVRKAYDTNTPESIEDLNYLIRFKNRDNVSINRKMDGIHVTILITSKPVIRNSVTSIQEKKILNIFDSYTHIKITLSEKNYQLLEQAYTSASSHDVVQKNFTFSVRADQTGLISFTSGTNKKKLSQGEFFLDESVLSELFA